MKTCFARVLLILLAGLASARCLAAEPLFETVTVFPLSPKNRPNYRIPALAVAPNKDLLLFAEKRNDGIGDVGNHDLVLARSQDHGRTWGKEELILDDGERTSTDSTICLDAERGRIYLFFLKDKKKFAYMASDDSGHTWRGPVIVHDSVIRPGWDEVGLKAKAASTTDPESAKNSYAAQWAKNWAQRYGMGPGAGGVQLTRGPKKGRLIVPARHLEDVGGKLVTFSHVIFSDDHGETWHLGANVAPYTNECRMIVLANGDVMMNTRNANPADGPDNSRRIVAISHDGGESWDAAYRDDALVSTTVHASLRVYNGSDPRGQGLILFSNPAAPIRQDQHPYGRYNLTVRWSRDEAQTWSAGRVIYPHPSSYSDLAILDDGTIGLVYERGAANQDHYWDELQFARFNVDWLLAPPHTPLKPLK
jgi:sialidase-1